MVVWDAVVLAGGRGVRLGGVDKAGLVVGGRTLLDRTLDAVRAAGRTVVVGDVVVDGVLVVRESPPHGGPAAAVGAALPHLSAPYVLLVACDHPFVADVVDRLVGAATSDGAVGVDPDGRRQHLLAVVSVEALRRSATALGDLDGTPLRSLLAPLDLVEVLVGARPALDIDTWHDHEKALQEEDDHG